MSLPRRVLFGLLCFAVLSTASAIGRADRVVLAPEATTLSPESIKLEFAINPYRNNDNRSWLQFSTTEGIEFEAQRFDLSSDRRDRYSASMQYPLVSNLGAIPAISLGVRDFLGTGVEHGSFYLTTGKSVALSDRQLRVIREFKMNVGVGTGYFGGPFLGIQTRLRGGISLDGEVYRRRLNVSVGLPLVRNMQAKCYSLDGAVFYGLSYTLVR